MTKQEKLNYLREHHYVAFTEARAKAIQILDEKYSIVCACGRLATGFHTNQCKKFNNEVNKEIILLLHKLLPK